jgi:hypothetical protein
MVLSAQKQPKNGLFRGTELEILAFGFSADLVKMPSSVDVRTTILAKKALSHAVKERRDMKKIVLLVGLAVSFVATGCMTGYYAHRERGQMVAEDTLLAPPMTIDDVVALAKDSVSDDVIISQIKATDSYFRLTTDDILTLKKEGVSERVITAMIQTSQKPQPARRRTIYSPMYYPYWSSYWYPYSWYPYSWYDWYPSVYYGYSHIGGYYGGRVFGGQYGGHPSAGHYGGRASAGHRSGAARR